MTDQAVSEQRGLLVKNDTNAIPSTSQNSVWYKSSYPFILIALGFLNLGKLPLFLHWGNHSLYLRRWNFWLFLLLPIVIIINLRHENWYQHLRPWLLLLLPLVVICIANLLLLRIAD
jgi:hypothetical protein